jgi:hypothetical protein
LWALTKGLETDVEFPGLQGKLLGTLLALNPVWVLLWVLLVDSYVLNAFTVAACLLLTAGSYGLMHWSHYARVRLPKARGLWVATAYLVVLCLITLSASVYGQREFRAQVAQAKMDAEVKWTHSPDSAALADGAVRASQKKSPNEMLQLRARE